MPLAVSPIDIGADAAFGVLVAGVGTAVVVTWRRATRRIRRFKSSPGARGAIAFYETMRAPGGLRANRTPARLRLELWQAVAATTRAVNKAIEAGAPLGELPALTRRLHAAAGDLDRLLSIAGGVRTDAAPVADLRRQVGEALHAAEVIRTAALASASDMLQLSQLAADAEREVQSVAAGVDRARTALH